MNPSLQSINDTWLKLMRDGLFEDAWCISDAAMRTRKDVDCSRWPRHLQFIWNGAPLAGKRVLVRCYHGLGDTIQFARFIAPLSHIAREVTLWAQPVLIPLLSELEGVSRVMPLHDGAPNVEYDVDIEIGELMHAFRATESTLASNVPYLRRSPRHRTPVACTSRSKVGLVWRAGEWNERRSVPCAMLKPLDGIAGVDWLLMQRGTAIEEWCHDFGVVPCMANIVAEAELLCELDLLITVDTCSAHLAGALGVPVWTLLPAEADWRWLEHREDSPWYPSMRLFRQRKPGQWHSVVASVSTELTRVVADRERGTLARLAM
jgi:ADP-heptose:LPS heptosyltransferase